MKTTFFSLFLSASLAVSAAPFAPGDTNKIDQSGRKQGFWKEVTGGFEWYGYYSNDQKNGSWVSFHSGTNPPQVSKSESWVNGKRNGLYTETDRNGSLTLQKSYKNDSLNGVTIEYSSGARPKSETPYHSGKINGIKKLYNQENFKLQEEGLFVNNKREGLTRWYYVAGKVSIEYMYKDGNLEGPMKTYYENGNISSQGTYVNNELEGDYAEFYEDGNPKSLGKYLKGKKEGIWKEYDENGKLKNQKYKNDQSVR